jgi:hypothetical protein
VNATVTLDEVLAAASARAASLVPETSGYLALAIGDATARLPFRVRDRAVQLTTEGTVTVARGKESVNDVEAAFVLRDILARLLSVSMGTMRGLANAARARGNDEVPVDELLREIEAALIPVNRTAARRALGRLARETIKAKEAGALGEAPAAAGLEELRRPAKPARVEAKPARAEAKPARAEAKPARAEVAAVALVPPLEPPSDEVLRARARYDEEWDEDEGAAPAEEAAPTPTEIGMSVVEEDEADETARPARAVRFADEPVVAEEAPAADEPLVADAPKDPLPAPEALLEKVQRAPRVEIRAPRSFRTPPPGAVDPVLSRAGKKSRVDDLLDRFGQPSDEELAMRSAARSLRAFAGLDATPPPLGVVTLAVPSPAAPVAAKSDRDVADLVAAPSEPPPPDDVPDESGPRVSASRAALDGPARSSAPPRSGRPRLALPLLLVALGLAGTMAWHFQESLRAALSLSRL